MKKINKLEFELYYSKNYCQTFTSLDKAIKMATDTYLHNPDMAERNEFYSIELKGVVIVIVKCENNQINIY